MGPKTIGALVAGGVLILILVIGGAQLTYVVHPGHRGVKVTLGRVSPQFEPEGFGVKLPFLTRVDQVLVRQQVAELDADCYSSDLQQVKARLKILYRIPQESVVNLYRSYLGDPFQSLVAPRVHEALKEAAALRSAEMIVQKREDVKVRALELAQQKIGTLIKIEDLVIENIALSPQLEAAIELKMVQEQEASKAKFIQQRTEVEARTAVIRAEGEARAITLRGEALRSNPALVQLEMIEKWDGHPPRVVSGISQSAEMILPLRPPESPATPATPATPANP